MSTISAFHHTMRVAPFCEPQTLVGTIWESALLFCFAGDSLLCAAILTFLTSLPEKVRKAKEEEWRSSINSILSVNAEFGLRSALSDEVEAEADLQVEKLHDQFDDPFFYDNLAIVR